MPITHQYINPFQGMASFVAGYFKTKKEREGQESQAEAQVNTQESARWASAMPAMFNTMGGAVLAGTAPSVGAAPKIPSVATGTTVDTMDQVSGVAPSGGGGVIPGGGATTGGKLSDTSLAKFANTRPPSEDNMGGMGPDSSLFAPPTPQSQRALTAADMTPEDRAAFDPPGFATDDSARRRADSRTVQGLRDFQEEFGQWQRDVANNDWRKRVGLSMMGLGPMPTYPSGATGTPAAYRMGAEDIAAGRFAEYGEAAGRQGIPSMFDPDGGYGYGGGYGGGRRRSRGRARGSRAGGGPEIPEGLDLVSLGYHTLSGDPYGGQGATGKTTTEGVGKPISEDMAKKLAAERGFATTTDLFRHVGLQQHRANVAQEQANVVGGIKLQQEIEYLQSDVIPLKRKQVEEDLRTKGRVERENAMELQTAQARLRQLIATPSGLTPEQRARARGEVSPMTGVMQGGHRQQKAPPNWSQTNKAKQGAVKEKIEAIKRMDQYKPRMKRLAIATLEAELATLQSNEDGPPLLVGPNSLFEPVNLGIGAVKLDGALLQLQDGKLEHITDVSASTDITKLDDSVWTRNGVEYVMNKNGEPKALDTKAEDTFRESIDAKMVKWDEAEDQRVIDTTNVKGVIPYATAPGARKAALEQYMDDYFAMERYYRTHPRGMTVAEPKRGDAPAAQDITPWYIDERSAMSFSEFSMRHARGEHGIGDLVKDGPGAYRRWQGGPAASDVGDPRNWKDMPRYRD